MSLLDLVRSALLSLKTHKLRVFLTMIGIIIGISSVVIILSIGAGLKEEVIKNTDTAGVNTITINFTPEDITLTNVSSAFDRKDFNDLKNIDGVENVTESTGVLAGITGISENASFFNRKATLFIDKYTNKSMDLDSGRLITNEDNKLKNYVIILTYNNAKTLFGSDVREGLGKGIKIKGEYFEVIGIQKDKNQSLLGSYDYVPSFAKTLLEGDSQISSIDVKIKQGADSKTVFNDVKKELKILHPDLKGKYEQQDSKALTKSLQKIISSITMFIAVVSGISLFVGGIGVMNIMYVSVTERRREIGIRRAIGAKPNSILAQFLLESIFITLLGGILGILFGYLISLIIGVFLPFKPVLTLSIMLGSSVTSIIVGIIFGIIPAYNAANLDPIKAIYK